MLLLLLLLQLLAVFALVFLLVVLLQLMLVVLVVLVSSRKALQLCLRFLACFFTYLSRLFAGFSNSHLNSVAKNGGLEWTDR